MHSGSMTRESLGSPSGWWHGVIYYSWLLIERLLLNSFERMATVGSLINKCNPLERSWPDDIPMWCTAAFVPFIRTDGRSFSGSHSALSDPAADAKVLNELGTRDDSFVPPLQRRISGRRPANVELHVVSVVGRHELIN